MATDACRISGTRALVIDSNPTSRSVLVSQLNEFGLKTVVQISRVRDAMSRLGIRRRKLGDGLAGLSGEEDALDHGGFACSFLERRRHPELAVEFIAFTGIDGTRFRATVEPPCRLWFVGKASKSRVSGSKVIFSYEVQGLVEQRRQVLVQLPQPRRQRELGVQLEDARLDEAGLTGGGGQAQQRVAGQPQPGVDA